jgi:hypothetical protein
MSPAPPSRGDNNDNDSAAAVPQYHTNLRAPIATAVGRGPRAPVHAAEIAKVGRCVFCFFCLGEALRCVFAPPLQKHNLKHNIAQIKQKQFKVRAGLPVEINPSVGDGFKVMSWAEYFGRFKTSPEFPECLACGGGNTKEVRCFVWMRFCCRASLWRPKQHRVAFDVVSTHTQAPPTLLHSNLSPLEIKTALLYADVVPRQARLGRRVGLPGLPEV